MSKFVEGFEVFAFDDTMGMPRKIRQLIADLEKHGFVDRGGKGSHRNFLHPSGVKITLSGARGEDAKHYQERDLKRAMQKIQS
jgi:predicted RNA binding protein YcfA (HicA-like mRNA interferase family)